MATVIKTAQIPAKGGLDLLSNRQELLKQPNVAEHLINFEPGLKGGYQQLKGYEKVNVGAIPGSGPITGILKYREGLVVCRDTVVYYSTDFTTWYAVNKDETDVTLVNMDASVNELPRVTNGNYRLNVFAFGNTERLVLTDGVSRPAVLTIAGDSPASYVVSYEEIVNDSLLDTADNEIHQNQAYYFGQTADPHVVYFSGLNDPTNMETATAGFFSVPGVVTGVKFFKKELYVFTAKNISIVSGVNSGQIQVQTFTDDVGCIDAGSIQEIGGDVVFLAADGLRTLRTALSSDTTENSTVSRKVNGLLVPFIKSRSAYTLRSTVVSAKNQYRLFFTKIGSNLPEDHIGFIGTYMGEAIFEWSTLTSFEANAVGDLHFGDTSGDIFEMERGNSYNDTSIESIWETPWFDMDNIGIRKALKYIQLDMQLSEAANVTLEVFLDYNDPDVHNPEPFIFTFNASSINYGAATYGLAAYPFDVPRFPKEYLEGSGHSFKFRFTGSMKVDEWIVYGFALSLTMGGSI